MIILKNKTLKIKNQINERDNQQQKERNRWKGREKMTSEIQGEGRGEREKWQRAREKVWKEKSSAGKYRKKIFWFCAFDWVKKDEWFLNEF